jgi:hypothetical protein
VGRRARRECEREERRCDGGEDDAMHESLLRGEKEHAAFQRTAGLDFSHVRVVRAAIVRTLDSSSAQLTRGRRRLEAALLQARETLPAG